MEQYRGLVGRTLYLHGCSKRDLPNKELDLTFCSGKALWTRGCQSSWIVRGREKHILPRRMWPWPLTYDGLQFLISSSGVDHNCSLDLILGLSNSTSPPWFFFKKHHFNAKTFTDHVMHMQHIGFMLKTTALTVSPSGSHLDIWRAWRYLH